MDYVVRFLLHQHPPGADDTSAVAADALVADLPVYQPGDALTLAGADYHVVSLPRLKLVAHPVEPGRQAMLCQVYVRKGLF
ncbi:hypothetical protein DYU11_25220 [Fibrisoma montanum]|uniref:Uncharacterized protein n=1 Tax=Fibrisoma montanum TaxID=2305895 RepID=A0A418M1N2_9BACT|nr:hypothetical protein [Fibrisoma montanum]RIV19405.1 hypothetical protein DYU11_25220 [Fibrisoma montanum]